MSGSTLDEDMEERDELVTDKNEFGPLSREKRGWYLLSWALMLDIEWAEIDGVAETGRGDFNAIVDAFAELVARDAGGTSGVVDSIIPAISPVSSLAF